MAREKEQIRKAKKGKVIRQVAAVPCRIAAHGDVELLLITSNTTRRFIVPKGWPMKGKSARKAAETEAREEAGIFGRALKEPIGTYTYWKRLSGHFVNVSVEVYLLPVVGFLTDWAESAKRKRAWLSPAQAATLIDEPQLSSIVGAIDRSSLQQSLPDGSAERP